MIYPKVYWRKRNQRLALHAVGSGGSGPSFGLYPNFFRPQQIHTSEEEEEQKIHFPRFTLRSDTPNFSGWKKGVFRALEEIREGKMHKVVLARKTTLTFSTPPSPYALVQALGNNNPRATLFLLQTEPTEAFFGASPEMLYERKGRALVSDALAGTRGKQESIQEFLQSEKIRREFSFVQSFLEETLTPLCVTCKPPQEPSLLQVGLCEHLYIPFEGILKDEITDAELLMRLHPTPALGGHPRKEALLFQRAHEPFSREGYGSPIGWMSENEACFAVAIRSAHLRGNRLELWAGAGIVEGSDPDKEWEELDLKISAILHLLS